MMLKTLLTIQLLAITNLSYAASPNNYIDGETSSEVSMRRYIPYVVGLKSKDTLCTGVIMDEYTILTARHCITSDNLNDIIIYSDNLTLLGGINEGNPDKIIRHPNPSVDLAILKTLIVEFTDHNEPIPWDKTPIEPGEKIDLVGFGDANGNNPNYHLRWGWSYLDHTTSWGTIGAKYMGNTSYVETGDSGGPIFRYNNYGLVGITVGTLNQNGTIYSYGIDINHPDNQKWIEEQMGY